MPRAAQYPNSGEQYPTNAAAHARIYSESDELKKASPYISASTSSPDSTTPLPTTAGPLMCRPDTQNIESADTVSANDDPFLTSAAQASLDSVRTASALANAASALATDALALKGASTFTASAAPAIASAASTPSAAADSVSAASAPTL